VRHRFVSVTQAGKIDVLVRELHDRDRGLTLVFVRTKRGADRLVKRLGSHDIAAVAMHGNKSQAQRERALTSFEDGRVDTLVATDVAARGLDIDDITHVINFDAPEDREGYVHRIGRTGRAGKTGTGITFVAADQAENMRRIARGLAVDGELESSGKHGRTPDKRPVTPRSRPRSRSRGRRGRRAPA
jgi:superfamily II DNA/RNA helicase